MNIAAQLNQAGSHLEFYRAMLQLRHDTPALQLGTYIPLNDTPESCFVYRRAFDGAAYVIALNFSDTPQVVSLADQGIVVLSTTLEQHPTQRDSVTLAPYEGVVVRI